MSSCSNATECSQRLCWRLHRSPNRLCRFDKDLKLSPLGFLRQLRCTHGAPEAALRTHGQLLNGQVLGCSGQTALQRPYGFDALRLSRDQAQDDHSIFADEAQRFESAGALGVVLKEESLVV